MYIVQIKKTYDGNKLKSKACRLLEYNSLENIHNSIINNKREVYSDDYLIGNLCPICPDILGQGINENELFYIIKLWNGDIMINQFIKI